MMKIWHWIEENLSDFRDCFSREIPFRWFVIVVVGLLVRSDHLGVTSIVRALDIEPVMYEALLHFFRSTAWTLSSLREHWPAVVLRSGTIYLINGRPVLIGDGEKCPKEGRKVPGVGRLHQESENSAKPEYIFGHLFGAIGVLVGDVRKKLYCVLLSATLHQGAARIRSWEDPSYKPASHVVQILRDAAFAAKALMRSCYLLLDAYFLTIPLLQELKEHNKTCEHQLTLVTRARSSTVAYEAPKPYCGRGCPQKHGPKVKLKELFQTKADAFKEAKVDLYGQQQTIQYLCLDLLWGDKLYEPMRFVLVRFKKDRNTAASRAIFVCSDRSLSPEAIIEMYGYRFKIEPSFRSLNQDIAGMKYRFWSDATPKLDRYSRKGAGDPMERITHPLPQAKIVDSLKATEGYVMCSLIALGLLQMASILFSKGLDSRPWRWLRTVRNRVVSEGTMREMLQRSFFAFMVNCPDSPIPRIIRQRKAGGRKLGDMGLSA